MAKLMVSDSVEGAQVPFLRGILTRSLQDCGLPFVEAYRVASVVRSELQNVDEISSVDLRRHVLAHVKDAAVAARYADTRSAAVVMVRCRANQLTPFSRGRLSLGLQSSGLDADAASDIAAGIYADLLQNGIDEIATGDLQRLTHEVLDRDLGSEAAQDWIVWEGFRRSGRPLVLLIGGITGSGKSTVAADVAHIVDILRTQSTDMLREVMRMMVPKRMLPVLHAHSFRAWQELPANERAVGDQDAIVANGYLTQAELLSVACEAAIARSLDERVSIIIEGVHARPALRELVPPESDAVVVPVCLAVLKPKQLRKRLEGRGEHSPRRHVQRHLDNFDSLWRLQTFLLSEADRYSVPIIENDDRDRTVQQVIHHVVSRLREEFSHAPEDLLD